MRYSHIIDGLKRLGGRDEPVLRQRQGLRSATGVLVGIGDQPGRNTCQRREVCSLERTYLCHACERSEKRVGKVAGAYQPHIHGSQLIAQDVFHAVRESVIGVVHAEDRHRRRLTRCASCWPQAQLN